MKTDNLPPLATDVIVAFCLLSRLPMPVLPSFAFESSARAVWAYPIVGMVVAGVAVAGAQILFTAGLPAPVAAGVLVVILVLLTGAMHEDGLADCADGFWGAQTREARLRIMKDSQIGSYGTLALIVVTGLRWSTYAALLPVASGPVIAAAALSRGVMPVLMHSLPHARDDGLAKSVGQPSRSAMLSALAIGTVVALVAAGPVGLLAGMIALLSVGLTGALARRKVGGQTGDILGATQQLSEVAVLCTFVMAFA